MDKSELIESTQNNELMKFLGVEIVEASAERVVMTMPVTPKVHQ
jgi:acyl-coenzyme A thioesterase PaaI-like protein